MIVPLQKDHVLLGDINTTDRLRTQLHLWWLGQSGYLMQYGNRRLLLDPYLSDSLTKKYANSDKPHTRISELVIDPGHLSGIDVATSSHNHTDHLDAETLLPLMVRNPNMELLIPEANRAFVADRLKCEPGFPTGLNDRESIELGGFIFHGIPAAHNELERDASGRCKYMGYVVQIGPFTIYHSGDTLLFPGMVELLKPFNIDLALLPINGNLPERRVAGNLDGKEAAWLAKEIGARLVIPCHYDLFAFNTADPAAFAAAATALHQPFRILQIGERLSFEF